MDGASAGKEVLSRDYNLSRSCMGKSGFEAILQCLATCEASKARGTLGRACQSWTGKRAFDYDESRDDQGIVYRFRVVVGDAEHSAAAEAGGGFV